MVATFQQFNRHCWRESSRQGWSREDVSLLLSSLDPRDEVVDLDAACVLIAPIGGATGAPNLLSPRAGW